MIAFKIFRLGKPHQDTLILHFGTKEIAEASNAQLEGGLVQNTGNILGSKRRRSSSEELNNALVNALNSFSTDARSTRVTSAVKKRKSRIDALAEKTAELDYNDKRLDSMAKALRYTQEIEAESRADPRIVEILKTYCSRLADEIENCFWQPVQCCFLVSTSHVI